ncbi:unnamed protein product [Rhizophagus irregularis]|uniref:Uncharacterized protein n=1 Tax=Rhizophagus irregularis TaxID=588596 RepID=A0A916A0Q4_9GLOM|nr:unnamed protein product [Rhizophagus irregularis]
MKQVQVFAGKTSLELNTIWNIFDDKNRSNVFYDDIYLVHQPTSRSHELEFTIDNEKFQEVVCHDERIGGNDEWIIELIDTHLFQYLYDTSK